MKRLISAFVIIVFPLFIYCQNYKLFHATSQKLFTEYPVPANGYSLAFDTIISVGADSVYYNYFTLNNNAPPIFYDSCAPSMGASCLKQNWPSWLGGKIIYNNCFTYRFFNLFKDTITFNFTTDVGDTIAFYKDSSQEFLLVYKKTDTVNVLNNIDSARFYTIVNTDINGHIINSALNGQSIIIAQNWGLIRFFQIDSFPHVLKPLALIGNISPTGGLYELTNEMLYDYQVGDEIQYKEGAYQYLGPPWMNYTEYETYTILSRTNTADSIIYKTLHEYFYLDSAQLHTDTVTLKYLSSQIIAKIPFEKYEGYPRKIQLMNYCGTMLWTYSASPDCFMYQTYYLAMSFCNKDTTWCCNGEPGPPGSSDTSYVIGLGIYLFSFSQEGMGPPDYGYSFGSEIVYFNKNGIECGTQVTVGIKEPSCFNHGLTIYPNPATNVIIISSEQAAAIEITNIQGQLVKTISATGNKTNIDVSALPSGVYAVEVKTEKGVEVKKFIKE